MARQWKMTLEGAAELEKVLQSVSKSLSSKILKEALMRAGSPMAQTASRILKSQIKNKTGVLLGRTQSGVFIGSVLSKNQRRGIKRQRGVSTIYIGPYKARHAHLIEFGTAPRKTKTGAYRGALRPRPFMRPAWEMHKAGILESLGKEMWDVIERDAKKIARSQARMAKKRRGT